MGLVPRGIVLNAASAYACGGLAAGVPMGRVPKGNDFMQFLDQLFQLA